jgi:hypothetical protein
VAASVTHCREVMSPLSTDGSDDVHEHPFNADLLAFPHGWGV